MEPLLEVFCIIFLDCLPTENRSSRCHQNSVFREVRGHGFGIILVQCIAKQIRMRVWRFSQGVEFGSLKLLDMGAGRSRRVWHSAQHGKEAAEEFGQKLDFRAVGFAALVF